MPLRSTTLPAAALAAVLASLAAGNARAATIAVDITADEYDTSGSGTGCALREAIQAANDDAAFGGCTAGAGADTITLTGGSTYTLVRNTGGADDTNEQGDLDITSAISFSVTGVGSATVSMDAVGPSRVLHVISGSLTASAVVITGGADGDGAGVLVASGASLSLTECTLSANAALSTPPPNCTVITRGGAIHNAGTLTVSRCTFTDNKGELGAAVYSSGAATLSNVTIAGNDATRGCGSSIGRGAVYAASQGTILLENATVSGNTAANGGSTLGHAENNGEVFYRNSIIVGSCSDTGNGKFTSHGFNVVNGSTCTSSGTGDTTATVGLQALATNGGALTQTMAPSLGSPSINGGACTTSTGAAVGADQTGFARTTLCDVGAFEARCATTAGCADSNVCTADTCAPATGCVYTNNTIACDDANTCTVSDTCSGGTCAGSARCNGLGTCTSGVCACDAGKFGSRCEHTVSVNAAATIAAGTTWSVPTQVTAAFATTSATATFTTPAGTTFASGTGCTAGAGTVTCTVGTLAQGASATVTPVFLVDAAKAAGSVLSTTISTASFSEATGGVTTAATATVEHHADLVATSSSAPSSVIAGNTLQFTVVVSNNGPSNSVNTRVDVPVPSGTTFSSSSATCTGTTTRTCSLGTLAVGGTGSFTISFQVPASLAAGNFSSQLSALSDATETVAGDNTKLLTGSITRQSDLSLASSSAPATVTAGADLTLTLVVSNGGPSDAASVQVSVPIPAGTTFKSAGSSAGCTGSGSPIVCSAGSVTAGSSTNFLVLFTVPSTASANSSVESTPSVSSASSDAVASNNSVALSSTVSRSSDLNVTASTGPSSAVAGTAFTVSAVVTNAGPSAASSVVVEVTKPSGTTFVAASSDPSCSDLSNKVQCTVASLAVGATSTLAVALRPAASATAGTVLSVTVSASSASSDPTASNDQKTLATFEVSRSSDLAITSSTAPATLTAGDNLTWTLVAQNVGPSDAAAVVVTATIPSGATYVDSSSDTACDLVSGKVSCSLGTLTASGSKSATVVLTTSATLTSGSTLASTLGITGASADPTAANDAHSLSTTVQRYNLGFTGLVGAPNPVSPDQVVAFTAAFGNTGTAPATNTTLQATVPVNTTFSVSGSLPTVWSCADGAAAGSTCNLSVASVAAGASSTARFAVRVNATVAAGVNTIAATATIQSAAGTDADTNDNTVNGSVTLATTVVVAASLNDAMLTDADSDGAADPGDVVRYTTTITNTGSQAASSVALTASAPSGTTLVANSVRVNGGGSGSSLSGVVVGTLNAGASATVAWDLTIVSPAAAGLASVSSQATVSGGNFSAATSDDPATAAAGDATVTVIDAAPNLVLAKSTTASNVAPGGSVAYSLTLSNAGSQHATGVAITETVPVGATFDSGASTSGWTCTDGAPAGTSCTFTIGNVTAGVAALTRTFAVKVTPTLTSAVTSIANTATAADDGTNGADLVPGNNTATASASVAAARDVYVSVASAATEAAPGATLSYTISYGNQGTATAAGQAVTATVPAKTTFVVDQSSGLWSCPGLGLGGTTCSFSNTNVAAGTAKTAAFVVRVDDTLTAATAAIVLSVNTTITSGSTSQLDTTNDSAACPAQPTPCDLPLSIPVRTAPDLQVSMTADAASVVAGQTLKYTVTHKNMGTRDSVAALLTTTVPANTSYLAGADSPAWTCANGGVAGSACTLSLGTLATSSTATKTFTVKVASALPETFTGISDTVVISDDPINPAELDATNNSATVASPAKAAPDLSISVVASGAAVTVGTLQVYTLTLQNQGAATAHQVTVSAVVPNNSTFNDGASLPTDWSCADGAAAGTTCTFSVSALAVGASQTIDFAVTVDSSLPRTVSNVLFSASIAADSAHANYVPEIVTSNNAVAVSTPIEKLPDLRVSVTASISGGGTVTPGAVITYTLSYSNQGTQTAFAPVITETIPAFTTFTASGSSAFSCPSGTTGGKNCTLTVANLSPFGSGTATFKVTVDAALPAEVTEVTNVVSFNSSSNDLNFADNSATHVSTIGSAPDPTVISLTHNAPSGGVKPTNVVAFTVTYDNVGSAVAASTNLVLTVPAETTFTSAGSTSGWSCSPSTGAAGAVCRLARPNLASNAQPDPTATFVLTVDSEVESTVITIPVTASIELVGGTELSSSNNSQSVSVAVAPLPDLVIQSVDDGNITVGLNDTLAYTITYENTGRATASGVVLREVVPVGTTYVQALNSEIWTCTPSTAAGANCTLTIGTLAINNPASKTFTVRVNDKLTKNETSISNTVTATVGGTGITEISTSNNSRTELTPVEAGPDLLVTKVADSTVVTTNQVVKYTLTVENRGTADATNVVVTERVPANTTYVGGDANTSMSGNPVAWDCGGGTLGGTPCTLALGAIAKTAGPKTLTYTVMVNSSLTQVAKIFNTVSVADDNTHGDELDATNDSFTHDVLVGGAPDLSVTATPSVASVTAGQKLIVTLQYKNAGSEPANASTLTVTLPPTMARDPAAGSPGWSCVPAAPNTKCTLSLGSLAAGLGFTTKTIGIQVASSLAHDVVTMEIPAEIAIGEVGVIDLNPPDNTTTASVTVQPGPRLVLSKTTPTVQAKVNENILYTLAWKNVGTAPAEGVVLTETVPATTVFSAAASDPAWQCAGVTPGSVCTYDVPDLPAAPLGDFAGSAVFAVTVDSVIPPTVTEITNVGSLDDDGTNGTDLALGADATMTVKTLARGPDLVLTATPDKTSPGVGATVAWTLRVENKGTANAPDITFTTKVPRAMTFAAPSSSAGWSCAPSSAALSSCSLTLTGQTLGQPGNGVLPTFTTVTFAAVVDAKLPAGVLDATLAPTATSGGTVADLAVENNSTTSKINLTAGPDLVATITADVSTAMAGEKIVFTPKVENRGTRGATAVLMTVKIPTGTRFSAADSDATWSCPALTAGTSCTYAVGNLEVDATNSGALGVVVDSPLAAGLESTAAQVTATDDAANGADLIPATNASAVANVVLDAAASLHIAHEAPTTVPTDSQYNYSLKYWNSGTQNAAGVVLTATVPLYTTYVAGASSPGWSCDPADGSAGATCTLNVSSEVIGNRALETASTAVLAVRTDPRLPTGVDKTSSVATIRDNVGVPVDETKTTETTIDAAPDLVISQNVVGTTFEPGDNITYNLTVRNDGSQVAVNSVVRAVVPAHTTFQNVLSTVGWSCIPDFKAGSACTLSVGTLQVGAAVLPFPASFIVKVDAPVAQAVTSTECAVSITDDGGNGPDLKPESNSAKKTVNVLADPSFSLSKVANLTKGEPGDTLVYTLTYQNVGNQHATGVEIRDVVPANTTFKVSASDPAWICAPSTAAGSTCTLSKPLVEVGPSAQTTFAVVVDKPVSAGVTSVTNSAAIRDDGSNHFDNTPRPVTSNAAVTQIDAVAGLDVGFQDVQPSVAPGGRVTYTVEYQNGGAQNAKGVDLIVTIPANVRFDLAGSQTKSFNCALQGAGTQCTHSIGNVPVGPAGIGKVSFAVEVDPLFPPPTAGKADAFDVTAQIVETGGDGGAKPSDDTATTPVARCSTEFNFETSGGAPTTDGLWAYVQNGALGGGYWKTAGDAIIKESDPDLVHLNFAIAVPETKVGGLAPLIEVVYLLNAEASPTRDFIALCLFEPKADGSPDYSCNVNTPGVVKTGQDTKPGVPPGTGGQLDFNDGQYDHALLDASKFVGKTAVLSVTYQTNGADDAYPGLSILSIRQYSDADGDNQLDGRDAVCDICWDTDTDGFANSASPAYVDYEPKRSCVTTANPLDAPDCDDTSGVLTQDCSEDCADGVDNNNNNLVDCADNLPGGCSADPFCSECERTFNFDSARNLNGWSVTGDQIFEVTRSQIFTGFSTTAGAGKKKYTSYLVRDIVVPGGMPEPMVEVRYKINGSTALGTDKLGVCFDQKPITNCQINAADADDDNSGEVYRTFRIPVPPEKVGSDAKLNIGIYYDSVVPVDVPAAVQVDLVAVRSDMDIDKRYENDAIACDHCIDRDQDFYGDGEDPYNESATCTDNLNVPRVEDDCDDGNPGVNPGVSVSLECAQTGDQNCDTVSDFDDPKCSVCGDGVVSAGEQCDDGTTTCDPWGEILAGGAKVECVAADGDGCSKSCQIEKGASPLYITEFHNARFGTASGQYFELYNSSKGVIDPVLIGLTFSNKLGESRSLATCQLDTALMGPGEFYVVSLGAKGQTGDIVADAYCGGAKAFSEAGDTIVLKNASGNETFDVVDFSAFTCESQRSLVGSSLQRSIELVDPENRNGSLNDASSAWCLSREKILKGDGTPTASENYGSPGAIGRCGELFCDGVDDDCDDLGPDEIDGVLPDSDTDGFCDNPALGSNAGDCDPTTALCSVNCTTNIDGTEAIPDVPDCKDRCLDVDHDGYGAPGNDPSMVFTDPANLPCKGVRTLRHDCEICSTPETADLPECQVCEATPDAHSKCSLDCTGLSSEIVDAGVTNCIYPRFDCNTCSQSVGVPGEDCGCDKPENQSQDFCAFAVSGKTCNDVPIQRCDEKQCDDLRSKCVFCKVEANAGHALCTPCAAETGKPVHCVESCAQLPSNTCKPLDCSNPREVCLQCASKPGNLECGIACKADPTAPECGQNCVNFPTRKCPNLDCNDAGGRVNPGDIEGDIDGAVAGVCVDNQDNDCDGRTDCSDEDCALSADCAGATCEAPKKVGCGFSGVVDVISPDYACAKSAGSNDAVLEFVANAPQFLSGKNAKVRISLDNGKLPFAYGVRVFKDSCPANDCSPDQVDAGSIPLLCGQPSVAEIDLVYNQTVYFVIDEDVGPCQATLDRRARVTVTCLEDCSFPGDEDADGDENCFDDECIGEKVCADADYDLDGFSNGAELGCGTDAKNKAVKPAVIDLDDSDADGSLNCNDPDADGDGLLNEKEGPGKLGTSPYNADTDGDGLSDGVEDASQDGVWDPAQESNPLSPDTDGDLLYDGVESQSCYNVSLDPLVCETSNPLGKDSDLDGLQDGVEDKNQNGQVDPGETSPLRADTDGDGYQDGEEIRCQADPLDGDSRPTFIYWASVEPKPEGDAVCDGARVDSDDDGVVNEVEAICGTNPKDSDSKPSPTQLLDTDGDQVIDCVDLDDDDDTIPDVVEIRCGFDPKSDLPPADKASTELVQDVVDTDGDGLRNCEDGDDDGDGLSDQQEAKLGTEKLDADTDDDGISDGREVDNGLDPKGTDTDGDLILDGVEFGVTEQSLLLSTFGTDTNRAIFRADECPTSKTKPENADTDGDKFLDGEEDKNRNGCIDGCEDKTGIIAGAKCAEFDPNTGTDVLFDSDGDGIADTQEQVLGLASDDSDTDDDGLNDGIEINVHLTDPLNADTDSGGVRDGLEIENGTNPKKPEDDFSKGTLSGAGDSSCTTSKTSGSAVWVWLLALGVLGLRRRAGWLALALLAAPAAEAQVTDANFNTYLPGGGRFRGFTLQGSLVSPHMQPYGSVHFTVERESVRLVVNEVSETLVALQSMAYVTAGVGLYDWVQVEVIAPFGLTVRSEDGVKSFPVEDKAGLGDFVVRGRWKGLDNTAGGFGIGGAVGVTLPTGDGEQLRGDPGIDILADVAFDYRASRITSMLNVGGRFRTQTVQIFGTEIDHDLTFGVGVDAEVWTNRLRVTGEFFGRTPLTAPFVDVNRLSIEAIGGAKVALWRELSLELAVGGGVVRAEGTPRVRFVGGVAWTPGIEDSDGDKVLDVADVCPLDVEDVDGFQDGDGCPESDNDGDGIPDLAEPEECRLLPEDRNGDADDDGCPDQDSDGDRLTDIMDRCPQDAEDHDSYQDEDGCPESDNDADSILDVYDDCPLRAETYNGFKDEDGCPDLTPAVAVSPCSPKCQYRVNVAIRFVQSSAELTEEARATLRRLAEELEANDYIAKIQLDGYAWDEGDLKQMKTLSQARAEAVADYLIRHRVRSDVLRPVGHGGLVRDGGAESNDLPQVRTVEFKLEFDDHCGTGRASEPCGPAPR